MLAWVISILIMLGGIGGILLLPVEQYPDIAPPSVNIRASYPGASAETLESSVTQVIEQQLTGIDGLIYFSSTSNATGASQITVTFERGTDADIAQVQVQNKVQQALPRLPQAVQQQGLVVTKSNPDFLDGRVDLRRDRPAASSDVADYLVSNLQDCDRPPRRASATCNVFGSQYAMRIWLDPGAARELPAHAARRRRRPSRRRTRRWPPGSSARCRRRTSRCSNATVTARFAPRRRRSSSGASS